MDVPYQRYIRAIDPCGNICPLSVVSNRVDMHDEVHEGQIRARKLRSGWLFIDEPMHGQTLAQWWAHCSDEVRKRRAAKKLKEAEDATSFKNREEQLAQAAGQAASAASADVVREVFAKFFEQMQTGQPPSQHRRDK